MPDEKQVVSQSQPDDPGPKRRKIKLEVYGNEMLEREVRRSGLIGRLYLPRDWVGRRVKIIRID
jgi:hypothetical protein